jgi:hypothetical protein
MAKIKTLSQAETARRRAVTGLRNLGRDEDAGRIESLSARQYADEKGFEILGENTNPYWRKSMPRKTKDEIIAELRDEVADLEDENQELQGRLDEISDVVSGREGEEAEDESDDEEEDEDEEEIA